MLGSSENRCRLTCMLIRLLCLMLLSCTATMAQAADLTARVIVVLDGDTIMAVKVCEQPRCRKTAPLRIRLADIDAPEKDQPGGAESKESLSTLLLHKTVRVNPLAVDKYGRLVALLTFHNRDINAAQVRNGMAWEYSLHHHNRSYVQLQKVARQARRGLWQQPGHVAPWRWRRQHAQH